MFSQSCVVQSLPSLLSPDPAISVSVDAGVATPTVGAMYSLTCTVTGAERLTGSTITYQWFKDGVVVSGQTMETLSFTSLTFSDAGGYTCEATVMSSLLSGPITTTRSSPVDVTLICESLIKHLLLYIHMVSDVLFSSTYSNSYDFK